MRRSQAKFAAFFLAWVVLAWVTACGKNDSLGSGPFIPTAPAPNGYLPYWGGNNSPYGNYYPYGSPYGYMGQGGMPYYFNPQMPAGFPQSYYPFLPVDNYFRNHPFYGGQYWNQLWNQWNQTAGRWGVSPYDFPVFWNEFCPQVWRAGTEYQIYIQLGQTFYSWAEPQVVLPQTADPSLFWYHYLGIIY